MTLSRRLALVFAALAAAPGAAAQEAEWVQQNDLTSADLAEQGAQLLSSAAVPDGRDSYVSITYWEQGSFRRQIFRCVDRVNSFGLTRRSRCARASS